MDQWNRETGSPTREPSLGVLRGDTAQTAKFRAPFLEPVTIQISNLGRSESLVENYTKGFLEF